MGYLERKKLYKSISNIRKRPLIAYVTSIRPNLSGQMAGDAISPIIEQINKVPKSCKEIDFLIISNIAIINIIKKGKLNKKMPIVKP